MTIRIDSIKRHERPDGAYVWALNIKGFEGRSEYFLAKTGPDGHGLYDDRHHLTDGALTEILAPDRFWAHPECDARQVVHRVAAALVALGWGPEFYEDRDSISGDWWPYQLVAETDRHP